MEETGVVFITLLLLLIITCTFGGSMRSSSSGTYVQQHAYPGYGGPGFGGAEMFNEMRRADEEEENREKKYEGFDDGNVEADVEVIPADEEEEEGAYSSSYGMNTAPNAFVAEEFASY